jgi:hypothetical protein
MENTRSRFALFSTACSLVMLLNAQVIHYEWPNQGCATIITCNDGCTACNLPENSSSGFFGTNMIWVGVPVCPYPTTTSSLSLFSGDWPVFPSSDHYGLLSGIATTPMQIDSIIIRHARTSSGPHRLKVFFTRNPNEPMYEIADVAVDWNFENTVITDLGCLPIPEGAPYALFQLKVQAYDATGEGAWALDEVKIVGSTCSQLATGIQERHEYRANDARPYMDVLGRPVGPEAAPGVYMGGRRVVTIF